MTVTGPDQSLSSKCLTSVPQSQSGVVLIPSITPLITTTNDWKILSPATVALSQIVCSGILDTAVIQKLSVFVGSKESVQIPKVKEAMEAMKFMEATEIMKTMEAKKATEIMKTMEAKKATEIMKTMKVKKAKTMKVMEVTEVVTLMALHQVSLTWADWEWKKLGTATATVPELHQAMVCGRVLMKPQRAIHHSLIPHQDILVM